MGDTMFYAFFQFNTGGQRDLKKMGNSLALNFFSIANRSAKLDINLMGNLNF